MFLNLMIYSSFESRFFQCPVSIASPVIATNTPATRHPKTQAGTLAPPTELLTSSVSTTGHASTHRRQAEHSSFHTFPAGAPGLRVPASWTLIRAGHAFVQSWQSMHDDFVRVIFSGLSQLRAPRIAP